MPVGLMPVGLAIEVLGVAAVLAALLYLVGARERRRRQADQDGFAVGSPSEVAAASKRSS
jgi:hypothetical protein